MKICVFGAASYQIDPSYIKFTEELGEKMAQKGHELVFGAGGNGLMGAVARGVERKGGKIYGVIPSFFKDETIEKIFENCTELIFTETMAQRKTKMEDLADAFIVVPGGIGTFEELFEVLTLKQLGRHTKPIIILDVNGYYEKLIEFMNFSIKEKFICENCNKIYGYFDDIEKALASLENNTENGLGVHDLKIG